MSTVQINPTQKSRLYKIDVYGLQDNYLGTLQSYGDSFIGQIIDPELSISDDGTQSFSCSIPKFYIDPATNLRVINPRWGDIDKGVLAENTRILKVFIQFDNETKVFPFIIDSITDKRDNNFSVYRQITASGLAFAELGKIGYKIELSEAVIDNDRELFGYEPILNINYWLDKIFPNEKDESGNITKWLTPWSYEIKMDWQDHPKEDRASDKIYDDAKVASWKLEEDNSDILPDSYEPSKERQRIVEAANSNKYNITQSIAEAFEVFCVYEYKCDTRGRFIKSYTDELNHLYTGRKVVFYNRAIKSHNPLQITYQKNLDSISRISDTTDLYTKLYVPAVDDAVMDSGQISIANTAMNPIQDDFILNFDYLYNIGSITETQWNSVKKYKVDLRKLNQDLREKQRQVSKLQIQLNKLEAKITNTTNERDQAQERVTEAEQTLQALPQSEPIERTIDRPVPVTFFEDPENATLCKGKFNLQGIIPSTVKGYQPVSNSGTDQDSQIPDDAIKEKDSNGKEYWQRIPKFVQATKTPNKIGEGFYGILDDAGYLTHIIVSRSEFETKTEPKKLINTLVYFTLTYNEATYYEDIIEIFSRIRDNKEAELKLLIEQETALNTEVDIKVEDINELLLAKENLNQEFERKMGSALREGYWTPENTGGIYENINEKVQVEFSEPDPDTEEVGYTYDSLENREQDKRTYYPYIDLPKSLWGNTENNYLKDLTFILKSKSERKLTFQEPAAPVDDDDDNEEPVYSSELAAGYYSIKPYATSQLFYFYLENAISNSGTLTLEDKESLSLTFKPDNSESTIFFDPKGNSIPNDDNGNPVTILKDLTDYFPTLAIPLILQNNSGYVFAYRKYQEIIDEKPAIKYWPIAILNNDQLQYSQYTSVGYNYSGDLDTNKIHYNENLKIVPMSTEEALETRYPRIILSKPNINSDSTTTFKIFSGSIELTRYEEYSVIKDVEEEQTRISLKISENNTFAIFEDGYTIQYQVSHADDYLYQDAYEVALENSKPRFSYEVSISNLPHNSQIVELGQLAHINDYLLGANRMRGYVSGIIYKLDEPQSDSLTLQNYKTKFEDLFSTITASSEAMKTNQRSYNAAASSFDSRGNINGDILQNSIDANEIALNFSNTSVIIDDNDGILLTNKTAYANGVYGQVAIRGGGIFLSDSIDQTSGLRFWNTGITPHGINASLITTGQLDTNVIRIFAGSDMAFLWNAEGLNAFKREDNGFSSTNYIRYSGEGLHYILDGKTALALDWDGLTINGGEGTTSLDSEYGLVVYDGEKELISEANGNKPAEYNWLVRIGRFVDTNIVEKEDGTEVAETIKYAGMRLYQVNDYGTYVPTLDATNNGKLWLRNTLTIGGDSIDNATVGISGLQPDKNNSNSYFAFWAGKKNDAIENANFYVKHDGTLKATSGIIGQWNLNNDYLAAYNDAGPQVGLYFSSQYTDWADSPIRIFAGGSSGNRPFYISEAGRLQATEARFGDSSTYIELTKSKYNGASVIQSNNYIKDSSGWTITGNGYGEFSNIKVRGEISSVVFKREQISAIGGKLYLSPSCFYDSIELKEDNTFTLNNFPLSVTTDTNNDEATLISITSPSLSDVKAKCIGILNKTVTFQIISTKEDDNNNFPQSLTDVTIVVIGKGIKDEYILMDASGEGVGPFIDIKGSSLGTYNNYPQVRLGNLAGIKDTNFPQIDGYGLYSQNAYLTGQLVLPQAGITNQTEICYSGKKYEKINELNKDKAVRFWAGGPAPSKDGDIAPFIVTQDGTLYAFKGIFSGELQTAGIVIDTNDKIIDADHSHFYITQEYDKSLQANPMLDDYILDMNKNGIQLFQGSFAAYSDSANNNNNSNSCYYYERNLTPEKLFQNLEVQPYFKLYDGEYYSEENGSKEALQSRWISQAGQIFYISDIYTTKENNSKEWENYNYSSISFKDGIYFDNGQSSSKSFEYNNSFKKEEHFLKLQNNCLNISSNKIGVNIAEEDKIAGSIGIKGDINLKGADSSQGGVIVSVAQLNGEICGLNFISLYDKKE